MAEIIAASINLSKIDKSKIRKTDKDGKPFKDGAQYYSFDIIIKDGFDQYGNNVTICDKQTKEQREAGEKKSFLGNGKRVWQSPIETAEVISEEPNNNKADDDLPF